MSMLHMMVGYPGSGKTTWREAQRARFNSLVASSDDYIDAQAIEYGKTYNEVFRDSVKGAENHVKSLVSYSVKNKIPLIWDQTNLSRATRKTRLMSIPFDWPKVCVWVRCGDFDEWKRRLMSRPGKTIPAAVIESMMKNFEPPELNDGFDEILEIIT